MNFGSSKFYGKHVWKIVPIVWFLDQENKNYPLGNESFMSVEVQKNTRLEDKAVNLECWAQ